MNRVLKYLVVIGYLLFGTMWIKSLYNVTFYNSVLNIFDFKTAITSQLEFLEHPKDSAKMIVTYEFVVNDKSYDNQLTAYKNAFQKKVGISDKLEILYNESYPNANYVRFWKIDSFYIFSFIMFSLFLGLILYFHLFTDKTKWINRYSKALGQ